MSLKNIFILKKNRKVASGLCYSLDPTVHEYKCGNSILGKLFCSGCKNSTIPSQFYFHEGLFGGIWGQERAGPTHPF